MKIRNVTLALAGGAVVMSGVLSLTTLAAEDGANKNITMNPVNAVQHIVNVKVIEENGSVTDASVLKLHGKNLVGVQTNNFVISQEGENANEIQGGNFSNILGGSKNIIKGNLSTILGGQGNVNNGNISTILGGNGNRILNGESSVIVGGSYSELQGNNSVIVGGGEGNKKNTLNGNNSVVLGNGSSVVGDYSVALGTNSKIANNVEGSFLWTDGSRGELKISNVFVVKGTHGMVVNADSAHPLAQLTIGGPLVIHDGSENLECNDGGVVKVVEGDSGYKCFCGCDGGNYWHSLYGQGRCEKYCNTQQHTAECGSTVSKKESSNGKLEFEGTCNVYSKPVVGYGAYVVDTQGKVHWTCQTDAGDIAICEAFATN